MTTIGIGILNLLMAWLIWNSMPRLSGVNLGIGLMGTSIGLALHFN